MRPVFRALALIGAVSAVSACSTNSVAHQDDPLYGWNKGVFEFNNAADKIIVKPVAKGYRAVVPKPGRDGVRNILSNLRSPVTFGNDVLQGKFGRAGKTLVRFGINSTVGLLGLFDVADRAGIESHTEDMGQTLATWGVGSGPYIMLPILGPSNLRDATGFVLDFGMEPMTYMRFKGRQAILTGRFGVNGVSVREANLDTIESLRASSLDEYASLKSAYKQLRANAIADGEIIIDDLPDYDEYEDDE
ncbi:MAG: VacJ family lipoprotein [Robiginitomaculum sp.]|nr:MAG: VacJ family lipoprotein [Robiginitomaculum sp.]